MEKVAYLGQTLTRWRVGQSTFVAHPEHGARLMNWHVTLGDGSVRDVLYWPEFAAPPDDFAKVRGGNPILFPFNGRTFDGGDIHFWRGPDGVRRPMPMHGLARQAAFAVTRLDAAGFTAVMQPSDEARACYPFDYEFAVRYRFAPLALTCEFALTNRGPAPLPWSAGHHFYFKLPWTEGSTRTDYLIRVPGTRRVRHAPDGKLVDGPALRPLEPISNPALVDTIQLGLRDNEAVFGERGRPGDIVVRNGTEKVPPPEAAFVTWTMADDSPYYCVEPWMGPPNAWENKVGLHFVEPGRTEKYTVEVAVK